MAAAVGLVLLPIVPGYLMFAALAGGIVGISCIVVIKTEGRIQLGYIGLVAIPLLHHAAKRHYLPEGAESLRYGLFFLAVAIALGFGVALIYREVKKRA